MPNEIKLSKLLEMTNIFHIPNFGEVTAIIWDDEYVLFKNIDGKTKLKCYMNNEFKIYTDDNGCDYITFVGQLYTYRIYPIKKVFIKLKD